MAMAVQDAWHSVSRRLWCNTMRGDAVTLERAQDTGQAGKEQAYSLVS